MGGTLARHCERNWIDAILIHADVEDPDAIEAQLRQITLKLKPHATAKDVMWELENLFGKLGPIALSRSDP